MSISQCKLVLTLCVLRLCLRSPYVDLPVSHCVTVRRRCDGFGGRFEVVCAPPSGNNEKEESSVVNPMLRARELEHCVVSNTTRVRDDSAAR